MAGSKVEGLYDLLQEAVAQPQLSVSVGPPLPKRKWVATATVSSPTVQELEAIAPKPEGGVSVWGDPHLPIPQPTGEATPVEVEPLRINVGDTK